LKKFNFLNYGTFRFPKIKEYVQILKNVFFSEGYKLCPYANTCMECRIIKSGGASAVKGVDF
jgi:hypothetical protein